MKQLAILLCSIAAGCAVPNRSQGLLSDEDLSSSRAISKSVEREVASAKSIELVSLSPTPPSPAVASFGSLGGFAILGAAVTSDKGEIAQIARSLARGIRTTDGFMAMCFNPRHAIRYTVDGKPVVVLVCFECQRGEILHAGDKTVFLTSRVPEAGWDRIFSRHGLPKSE